MLSWAGDEQSFMSATVLGPSPKLSQCLKRAELFAFAPELVFSGFEAWNLGSIRIVFAGSLEMLMVPLLVLLSQENCSSSNLKDASGFVQSVTPEQAAAWATSQTP